MKNLYLLTTHESDEFYVIADNPTEAEQSLIKIYSSFPREIRVVKIEWLTEELKPAYNKPNTPFLFDDDTKLLIVDDWK